MTRGHAHGVDRKYQEHCRDFLLRTNSGLIAYSGDGCDVPFDLGGTTWTIDVALRDANGDLVVAECRHRTAPAKQAEVAAFAYQVELLRKCLGVQVSGNFFAKARPQSGAVYVSTYEGIRIAVLSERNDATTGFSIAFHRHDQERERRIHDYLMVTEGGRFKLTGGEVRFHIGRKPS